MYLSGAHYPAADPGVIRFGFADELECSLIDLLFLCGDHAGLAFASAARLSRRIFPDPAAGGLVCWAWFWVFSPKFWQSIPGFLWVEKPRRPPPSPLPFCRGS